MTNKEWDELIYGEKLDRLKESLEKFISERVAHPDCTPQIMKAIEDYEIQKKDLE